MSCHCDDWQVPAGFQFSLAYCPRRIESIHDWHLDIHQNHIKLVLKRNRNRFPTVLDRCDMVPMFFQDTDGESLVDHIVLGEQDPKFSKVRHRNGIRTLRRILWRRHAKTSND